MSTKTGKSQKKESILRNYKFLVYDKSARHSWFLKNETEVQEYLRAGEIGPGDILIEISLENIRVAEKINYVELI